MTTRQHNGEQDGNCIYLFHDGEVLISAVVLLLLRRFLVLLRFLSRRWLLARWLLMLLRRLARRGFLARCRLLMRRRLRLVLQ